MTIVWLIQSTYTSDYGDAWGVTMDNVFSTEKKACQYIIDFCVAECEKYRGTHIDFLLKQYKAIPITLNETEFNK